MNNVELKDSRNIRLDRIYGEEYSVESIKHKIYYIIKEKIPVAISAIFSALKK